MNANRLSSACVFASALALAACGDSGGGGGAGGASSTTIASSSSSATTVATTSGVLPPSCTTYCATIMANCTGTHAQYPDLAACQGACDYFPVGTGNDTTGDTLGCRVYHASVAKGDPDTHCQHAGPLGGGQCGANHCDGFCDVATGACPTDWPSLDDCRAACMTIADDIAYDASITTGDSLACRMVHLELATHMPTPNCSQSLATTSPGDPCTNP
jgi:hypothetical protein